jgi:DNA-binding NarL/FixJ family response regulator
MILLLSDDLIDASKTIAHGRAAGAIVFQCRTVEELARGLENPEVACCVIDLHHPALRIDEHVLRCKSCRPGAKVIAYGSHVDAARLSAARKAGCDEALPRSAYFERLPTEVAAWAVRAGSLSDGVSGPSEPEA